MKEINLRMLTISLLVILVSVFAMSLPSQAAATTLRLTPVRGIIGASVTVTGIGYPGKLFSHNKWSLLQGLFYQLHWWNNQLFSHRAKRTSWCLHCLLFFGRIWDLCKIHYWFESTHCSKTNLWTSTVNRHHNWYTFLMELELTVTFNGKKVVTIPAAPVTTSTGTFSLTFVVPSDTPNSYIVSVTDSFNYKANTVYTIT